MAPLGSNESGSGTLIYNTPPCHKRYSCIDPDFEWLEVNHIVAVNNTKELLESSMLDTIKRFCKAISSLQ